MDNDEGTCSGTRPNTPIPYSTTVESGESSLTALAMSLPNMGRCDIGKQRETITGYPEFAIPTPYHYCEEHSSSEEDTVPKGRLDNMVKALWTRKDVLNPRRWEQILI
jgi:hypothetical protein